MASLDAVEMVNDSTKGQPLDRAQDALGVLVLELAVEQIAAESVDATLVIVAALPLPTVKLAISAALRSFAPCMRLKPRLGVVHPISRLAAAFPMHAILFFLSFLVNYYPAAAL